MTFWIHLWSLADSTALLTLVTFLIALSAFSVYRRQKRDAKRDAANTILLEIEGAEQQLQKIIETNLTDPAAPGIFLMKNASWDPYRYLFVRDFDRNEWDRVTDFYNKCHRFDEAVVYQNTMFDQNASALRTNLQRILAEYADEHAKALTGKTVTQQRNLEKDYLEKRQQVIDVYISTDPGRIYMYYPTLPQNEARAVLDSIETSLSLTSAGIKLKRLSQGRSLWQRLKSVLAGKASL